MLDIPMDERLAQAVASALKRPLESRYDLGKVKALDDFSYCGDPYYEQAREPEEGDFSAIGRMENLHTLLFGTPRSSSIPIVLVKDFGFLGTCKKLRKLDLRWTNFSDCALLLELPALRYVRLPPRGQLVHADALEELAGRGVTVELPPVYVPPTASLPAQGSEPVQAMVEKIKQQTALTCWKLHIQPDVQPELFDSKFGGLPYWPASMPYPTDEAGTKLILLAQLNLEQLRTEAPLPESGMLQFFARADDAFGADWGDGPVGGFRVVWHEQIDRSVTPEQVDALDVPTHAGEDCWPVRREAAVTAEKSTVWMGPDDVRFDRLFREVFQETTGQRPDPEQDFQDLLEEEDARYLQDALSSSGHHLLGYPYFMQFDPREEDGPYDTLLFQMDSEWTDTEDLILWGDAGVANFFIRRKALENRDFSDVLYTWDCG